ncbi:chymotrypsin-2-like [Hyposmocoma kahamanoa]|uniref:chymotrypsin-2-like n=1 Tax=Hyposmocoma kahamanoa TaxID=1477025 RepID=UPI000E6D9C6D|nr:chymotrypsin-2-like [Hyposmocoma kahamanoa]
MATKALVVFLAFLVGSLAVPAPDQSVLFEHVDINARIVGGSPAAQGSVPYMVALTQGTVVRSLVCGGSILTPRTVLTAAHCIAAVFSWGSLSSSLRGVVGTNSFGSGGTQYAFARNVTHANYVSQTIKNDIGLLITTTDIEYSEVVQPIKQAFDFAPAGVVSRAAGWGRIAAGGAISQNLLELHPETIDGDVCVTQVATIGPSLGFRPPPVEPHIEICTFHSAGRGMCNGDSGSALVRVDRGEQIGIVSWGIPCARGAPDMFVRVSAYESWLEQNTV